MRILITGAAGNLGTFLARYLLRETNDVVNLMIHKTPLPPDLAGHQRTRIFQCDLAMPETLDEACANSDVVIHFAGVLFAPHPGKFLPITNTKYAKSTIDKAIENKVRRFVLISFPHVVGPTTIDHPCTDRMDGDPISIHAKTRREAECHLFSKAKEIEAISLRPGMIYGRDVLMIAFARKLASRYLLGVWRDPTPIHLISIDDFLSCCLAAIKKENVTGIYPIGDDLPITIQEFFDIACQKWKTKKAWRVPLWAIYMVAWLCEKIAWLFSTGTPLTIDFIDIGRVPYVCDVVRMRRDLLPKLKYPSIYEGQAIL